MGQRAMNKKGMFFTFDALVALSILLIAFSYVAAIQNTKTYQTSEYQQMHYFADDAIQAFSNTKFSSINETVRNEIVALPEMSGEGLQDKNVIEVIGLLWSVYNETDYRRNYSANITRDFFGPLLAGMNYSLKIGDYRSTTPTQIYASTEIPPTQETRKQQTSAFRIISGYKEKSPHTGFVARAYVTGAAKKTQSYAYFGGFEGNGNLTKILDLPSIIDTMQEAYFEMDAASNFTIVINGIYSGRYNISASLPLRAKNWTMPATYLSAFVPGQNNITIAFDDINKAYVGGGFIRVKYNTTQMDTTESKINADGNATERYGFPGIDGLINIYSSFYVPGALKSLGIQLHYLSEYGVFLNLGNISVYSNSSNESTYIYLNDTYLKALLDYTRFNQTMPVRFGTNAVSGMNDGSDAIMITDVSGSMGWWMTNNNVGVSRNCSDPLLSAADTSRLSVAKCADINFVNTVLGTPGQMAGLISYQTFVLESKSMNLTDNSSKLIDMINTYTPSGSTCIMCGIKNATAILAATINATAHITNKSPWYYNDSFLSSVPPLDSQGRNWTHINYSLENSWKGGNAVFGNGTHGIQATTNILGGITSQYPDLWDMADDKATPEIDFTSGINSTTNTFGLGAGDDGWDWGADYGNDNALARNTYGWVDGRIVYSTTLAGTNQCTNNDCSGGYGIQINITDEVYDFITSGGIANISFQYWWAPAQTTFENTDEVWIKGRWTEPGPLVHYFGTELSSANGDSTPEITRQSNPDNSITGTYNKDITSWITGPGTYYLDFGGKVMADSSNERGNFSFDNILLEINNYSNTNNSVYFRKNFTISNISSVGKGLIRILSGDSAEAYLNGALIFNNTGSQGVYWYADIINRKKFRQGNNILAVKLYTLEKHISRFDLELIAINESRNKAMLVMSDGQANAIQDLVSASTSAHILSNGSFNINEQAAINRSCYAYENYGIISHAVAFSSAADNATLKAIADCGHGSFYSSSNAEELLQIYQDIANSIISYSTQTAEISGDTPMAKLYTDSFIEYNYTPYVKNTYGNISLTLESSTFGDSSGNYSVENPKNGSYNITSKMAVIDVKATSYSSDYWTSTLETNSTTGQWATAFNLSTFGNAYLSLGDPFIVNVPVSNVKAGEMNYVRINTANNATNSHGGSPDNRVIYTIKVNGSVGYGNTFTTLENATDDAKKRLNDSLSYLGITITNANTGSQNVGKIPWMWGPAIMTLEVWK